MNGRKILLSLILFIALPLAATDFAGSSLVIPIAGRTAGAFGSEWRTDVVITNAARQGGPASVNVVLHQNGVAYPPHNVIIEPRGTVVLKDVLQRTFGISSGVGMIRLIATSGDAKITARARIYNISSSRGEFGQTVQALPTTKLSRETYLPGLSGIDGNRTNIGIANPHDTPANVFLSLYEPSGDAQTAFSIVVPAQSVRTINDIFNEFGVGVFDGATVQVNSSTGVYAYASVVRGDSGDADFIAGTGVAIDDRDAIIRPACVSPAPLDLSATPAPGYIVIFRPATNVAQTVAALSATYKFTPKHIYEHALLGVFAENLTQAAIAGLRCEASVLRVEQNALAFPLP